jgi:hypothetical protein
MSITPLRVVVVLVASMFAFGAYTNHSRRVAEHRHYEMERAQAEKGNPVLTLPAELPMDSPAALAQIGDCRSGLFGAKHKACQGNGTLYGLPAYVTVEKFDTGPLFSVMYIFLPPAKGTLFQKLTDHFGPAHRFDSFGPPIPPYGWCWPLPGGQEVVLENESSFDKDPQIAVYIESEVAANMYRLMEAIRGKCQSHPMLSYNAGRS